MITRWIPVNEKLPEEEQAVFVTYYVVNNRNRRYVMESYLVPGGKWYDPYRTFRVPGAFIRIIAWMAMPEPYDGIIPIN